MGGDSCSKGCEFESRHRIFAVTFVMLVWKDENKLKRGRGWPILKNRMCLMKLMPPTSNLSA